MNAPPLHPIVARVGPSAEQQPAVDARGCDVVVTAGAGTGKTRTLVARALSLLADGLPLRAIVAVTFTRKAAREMGNRLRRELAAFLEDPDLAPGERARWQQAFDQLDAARIGTIHQLCAELLRTHPAEAGVDPRFSVLDEGVAAVRRAEAVTAAMGWAATDPAGEILFGTLGERALRAALARMLGDRLGAEASVAALLPTDEPAAILAAWGRKLAARQAAALADLQADPAWREAVATLRTAIPADPDDLMAGQRALALATLEAAARAEGVAARCAALSEMGAIRLSGGRAAAWPGGRDQVAEVKAALGALRRLWGGAPILKLALNPADAALAAALPALCLAFARARDQYAAARERDQALDFDDLEAGALALLEGHPAIRREWQRDVVAALLVDEFQDTNDRQRRLVRALAGPGGRLVLVGDAKQSIYRFRGADVTIFRREEAQIAAAGGEALSLETCYRAHPALVQALNDLLAPVLGAPADARQDWEAPFAALRPPERARAPRGPAPYVELHLTVGSKSGTESLERATAALAGRLIALKEEDAIADYGEVAILCRGSRSFEAYENALDAAGIPYVTVAGRGFYDRPEVRETLNALAAIADPGDDLALAGLLRAPGLGLSDAALARLVLAGEPGRSLWKTLQATPGAVGEEEHPLAVRALDLIARWHGLAGRAPVADVLKAYLDQSLLQAALRRAGAERAARNLDKLLADAHASGLVGVEAFLVYVANLRDAGAREGEARAAGDGAAHIMTVHAAKGLEFPVVVLGDAGFSSTTRRELLLDSELGPLLPLKEENAYPAIYELAWASDAAREEAEEKRLLYVACTRAEQRLLVSGHAGSLKKDGTLSLSGWLERLASPLGLDEAAVPDVDPEGARALPFTLWAGDTEVAGTIYEPEYPIADLGLGIADWSLAPDSRQPDEDSAALSGAMTMMDAAIEAASSHEHAAQQPGNPRRLQSTIRNPQSAIPVGRLVHEALAGWRFPGDAGWEAWAAGRCRQYGLTDSGRIDQAIRMAAGLLERFRASPLYREMAAAERHHEVPFSLEGEAGPKHGVVDCLFRDGAGWILVEFKTDRVDRADGLARYPRRADYLAQVERYTNAVAALLGERPRALLCWLDVAGAVKVEPLP